MTCASTVMDTCLIWTHQGSPGIGLLFKEETLDDAASCPATFPASFSWGFPDSHVQWTYEQPFVPAKSTGVLLAPSASSWLICTHLEDRLFADVATSIVAAFHSLGTGIISWAPIKTNPWRIFGHLWAESRSLLSWNTGWFLWSLECRLRQVWELKLEVWNPHHWQDSRLFRRFLWALSSSFSLRCSFLALKARVCAFRESSSCSQSYTDSEDKKPVQS